MAVTFTDIEIADFIQEKKSFPKISHIKLKEKSGHKEHELEILGESGNRYMMILRENKINLLDFSVILGFCPPQTNIVFLLRRYNGRSHEHSNPLERTESFYDFHIHEATERYQEAGFRAEHYALPTDRYKNLRDAIECLYNDCNIKLKDEHQKTLNVWVKNDDY
jgi:hypothetical protein